MNMPGFDLTNVEEHLLPWFRNLMIDGKMKTHPSYNASSEQKLVHKYILDILYKSRRFTAPTSHAMHQFYNIENGFNEDEKKHYFELAEYICSKAIEVPQWR